MPTYHATEERLGLDMGKPMGGLPTYQHHYDEEHYVKEDHYHATLPVDGALQAR